MVCDKSKIKRMKNIKLSLVLFFVTSACWPHPAEEVLSEMSKKMTGFEDYQVTVSGEFWVKGPKTKERAFSSSKILVKGLKQYNETTGKDTKGNIINRLQVFDGKSSWDFDRVKGVIRKVDLSKTGEDIQEKLKELQKPTNLGLLGEFKYSMEEQKIEGRRYFVLTSMEPLTTGNQKFDKVVLWIAAESYLPYKSEMVSVTEIKAPFGDPVMIEQGTMQEFRDWKVNVGIPDYRFSLSIPEGVKVIDETERAKEAVRILREQMKPRKMPAASRGGNAAKNAESE